MVRLPELTYDLLQAIGTGYARTSSRVLSIVEEFESERNKICSLVEKFCSTADRVTGYGHPDSSNVALQ
jgi:hypothetical protein